MVPESMGDGVLDLRKQSSAYVCMQYKKIQGIRTYGRVGARRVKPGGTAG